MVKMAALRETDVALELSEAQRGRMKRTHSICHALWMNRSLPFRQHLARLVSWLALPPLRGEVLCPTMLGFDLCLSRDTGNTIYRLGFYEAGTLDVMRRCLRPDDVFVDAGASIGLMTLLASDLVGPQGRVLAFEPLPKRYRQLATSVRRNGRSNITAFPAGLASRPRVLKIFLDRPSPSMVQRDPSERCEISEVRVLDDVLRSEAVREVRMLKLDVEGFELEVLHGARELLSSPRAPILSVEYGVYRDESQGILDFLASVNRYRFFHLEHRKATPSPLREIDMRRGPLVGDNIFCFLDHHLTGPAAASLTLG